MAPPATSAKELYDLKQKAALYYQNNGVPKKMEQIINDMFYDNPSDVYGHLSNYFEKFALTPVMTKLRGREVLDSKAQPTLQAEVYCLIKNREQCIGTATVSSQNYYQDSHKPEERDEEDRQRVQFVKQAVTYINENMTGVLKGLDPTDQKEVDARIFGVINKYILEEEALLAKEREAQEMEEAQVEETESQKKSKSPKGKGKGAAVVVLPEEPRETLQSGCNALSVVSQVACITGAELRKIPLYEHISTIMNGKAASEYHIPLPVVTILASGKAAPGKLNCVKEFMVVPRHDMPLHESVKHISNIYKNIGKTLMQKSGVTARYVNEIGAMTLTMDKPEQGLDMIQDAINHLELKAGEDFHLILNCAAQEWFDYEKGKYEVAAGVMKGLDDMVDFWSDLLQRYPSIIGLIDPIRKQEKEQWMNLCDAVSEKCYIIGDYVWHRPGLLKDEELEDSFKTSGVVFRYENMNQVSDVTLCSQKMKDAANQIMVSACQGESPDTFLADLAVGVDAMFIKIGGSARGERVAKLNRLLQIEDTLKEQCNLAKWTEHVFPKISPPPPPEEEQEGEGSTDQIEPIEKKDSPIKKK